MAKTTIAVPFNLSLNRNLPTIRNYARRASGRWAERMAVAKARTGANRQKTTRARVKYFRQRRAGMREMKPNFSDFSTLAGLRFQPTEGQVCAEMTGNELSILDSKSGIYYGLDAVGARIWSLVTDSKVVGEVRAILLEEYDVEPHQVESDLAHLLQDLFVKGLIELQPPGAKRSSQVERATETH